MSITKNVKERESQFELLRLISQFLIVFYHILINLSIIYPDSSPILKGLWLPAHIGVIVFLLISGFFGIRPSIKGGGKLLLLMFVYTIPYILYEYSISDGSVLSLISNLFIVSNTPFWFMRTYLMLYLLSPMVNKYITSLSKSESLFFITILSIFSIYMGLLDFDPALSGGKNIVFFILIQYLVKFYSNVSYSSI